VKKIIDQLGNSIDLRQSPHRIVSLVPSQTELLAYLGLDNRVVGITKFCVHPEVWRKTKTIIGGTKSFRFDIIEKLKPDLIIGNKEENYVDGISQLRTSYPVWMSDVSTLPEALSMIEQIGIITETESKAHQLVAEINKAFETINKLPPLRTLYLIWYNPWMGVANGTFIHEMLSLTGLQNCLASQNRYPELDRERILELNPELILLSSEPFPFREYHLDELRAMLPKAKIVFVDGEVISWYGSRLLFFSEYLKRLKSVLR
jgi:ABC-type Fe3+-hydroxamate transport system substrate-binding protein